MKFSLLALMIALSPATGWAKKTHARKPSNADVKCEHVGPLGSTTATFSTVKGKTHVSLYVPVRGGGGVSGDADCEVDHDLDDDLRCEVKTMKGDYTVVYGTVNGGHPFAKVSPYMSMEIPSELTCEK